MSALRLELAPSAALAALLVGLHAAAAACGLLVLPGIAGIALAAALLALGLASAWSRALLAAPGSVRGIEIEEQGVMLRLASGDSFAAEVGQRRYVGRLMVTLPLLGPARRTLLVTADMLPPDSFRRMRVWALWGKLPVAAKQLGT